MHGEHRMGTPWFQIHPAQQRARLRLVCFAYAGGSAQVFSRWPQQMPNWLEVCAVQSPGRGRRFSEPPIAHLDSKVQLLRQAINQLSPLPTVFFGHSNGALLAFELARALQQRGDDSVRHLLLSAKRAPHLPARRKPIHKLPQSEFVAELKSYQFTPDEVLQNDELMALFSPMLRADFALSETHRFHSTPKFTGPATLMYGLQDHDVPLADVRAWADLIDGEVDEVAFDAGHFFLADEEQALLKSLNHLLESLA